MICFSGSSCFPDCELVLCPLLLLKALTSLIIFLLLKCLRPDPKLKEKNESIKRPRKADVSKIRQSLIP